MGLSDADTAHLERCLELAERGRRTAAPNPVVGAVVVRDGRVLGEGWHERPGGPHAEVNALAAAGDARGATVYVSLEPCSHHGRTPPCADALIEAGVARVVAAMGDPTPKVGGRGFARLRDAGVEVELADGDLELRALRMVAEWLVFAFEHRPHVTYKAAVSARRPHLARRRPPDLDLVAREPADGARAAGRRPGRWRSASAPCWPTIRCLTARDCDPPAERQPLRVVFDRRGAAAGGLTAGPHRLGGRARAGRAGARGAGAAAACGGGAGVRDGPALHLLGRRRISSLLLEGGPTLATGFLDSGQIDRLMVFTAPDRAGGGPGALHGRRAAASEPWKEVQGGRRYADGDRVVRRS